MLDNCSEEKYRWLVDMACAQVLTVQLPAFHSVSMSHDLLVGALKDPLIRCKIVHKGIEVSLVQVHCMFVNSDHFF